TPGFLAEVVHLRRRRVVVLEQDNGHRRGRLGALLLVRVELLARGRRLAAAVRVAAVRLRVLRLLLVAAVFLVLRFVVAAVRLLILRFVVAAVRLLILRFVVAAVRLLILRFGAAVRLLILRLG